MIYTVKIDGVTVYDEDPQRILTSPSVSMELNSAGSFTFTMMPDHEYYDIPKVLTSDVEVLENGEVIWFGRIMKIQTGFMNTKTIECEGALGYFNDSIQRPAEYDSGLFSVKEFFEILIKNHNSQVPANRHFEVGDITIDEKFVYRKLDYENTLECLTKMCLDAEGGYFITRKEKGKNVIDWVKEPPYTGAQPAAYAINITDLNQILDGTEIKTGIIPLGEADEYGDRVNIFDVNHGLDYIETEAAETYGLILQVVEFSGITEPNDLLYVGKKWLKEKQFEELTIELNVAELSYIDDNYQPFRLGQKIHCTSSPNLIDAYLPIVKMGLELDSATKTVTIGTLKKRELTEIYKEEESSRGTASSSSGGSGSGGSGGGGGSSTTKVYNGKLSIQINGVEYCSFTANSKTDEEVNIKIPIAETSNIDFEKELAEEVEA